MATFVSKFKHLPTRAKLLSLLGCELPPMSDLPFSNLPQTSYEYNYLKTLYDILARGRVKASRPGQHTLMLDDVQFSIDISDNRLPLLTSRYVPYRSFVIETLWFLSGSTDVKFLKENGVGIWDDWVIPGTETFEPANAYDARELLNFFRLRLPVVYDAWNKYKADAGVGRPSLEDLQSFIDEHSGGTRTVTSYPRVKLTGGSIGAGAYGAQWRKWKDLRLVTGNELKTLVGRKTHKHIGTAKLHNFAGVLDIAAQDVDQLGDAIKLLKKSPDSRRIIVSAWNPGQVPDAVLPPCHSFFQFISSVNEQTRERELTLKLTCRSTDFPIGAVFNIGQYALLAHMVAHVTKHKATKLIFSPTDCHVYEDQLPFVMEQLRRDVWESGAVLDPFPEAVKDLSSFTKYNIAVRNYTTADVHPNIPYPVAV